MSKDIRWKQRFGNYTKALASVKSAVELAKSRELSNLEKQGAVKSRNISSHTYDEATAQTLLALITSSFYAAFAALEQKMGTLE